MAERTTPVVAERLLKLLQAKPTNVKTLQSLLTLFESHDYQKVLNSTLPVIFAKEVNVGKTCNDIFTYMEHLSLQQTQDKLVVTVSKHLCELLAVICKDKSVIVRQLTDADIPHMVGTTMSKHQSGYRKDQKLQQLVANGFSFIENCSTVDALHSKLCDQTLIFISAFLDPVDNDTEVSARAIALTNTIHPGNKLSELHYPLSFFKELQKLFRIAVSKNIRSDANVTLMTLFTCFLALAKSPIYQCQLVTILKPNMKMLEDLVLESQGGKLLRTLLQILQVHNCQHCEGIYVQGTTSRLLQSTSKSGTKTSLSPAHTSSAIEKKCHYFERCQRFLKAISVNEQYLYDVFSRCFCEECMVERGDKPAYVRGNPPAVYFLPKGWARFGVLQPPRAKYREIWNNWHVAYCGTEHSHVNNILEMGHIPVTLTKRKGQPRTKNISLSPSIKLAGQEEYSSKTRFYDHGAEYPGPSHAQVAFQVRIKPNSYEIVDSNKLYSKRRSTDSSADDENLRWSSNTTQDIVLTGILMRVSSPLSVSGNPMKRGTSGHGEASRFLQTTGRKENARTMSQSLKTTNGVLRVFEAYDARVPLQDPFICVLYNRITPDIKEKMSSLTYIDGQKVKYTTCMPSREAQMALVKQCRSRSKRNSTKAEAAARKRVIKVINEHSKQLFLKHINLTVIKPDNVKSELYDATKPSQVNLSQEICIVFYVLKKHLIPTSEDKLPTSLGGFSTDVREGFFIASGDQPSVVDRPVEYSSFVLRPGCGICSDSGNCGTLGGFVKCRQTEESGYLASYHLFINPSRPESPAPDEHVFYVPDSVCYGPRPGRVSCGNLSRNPEHFLFGNHQAGPSYYGMDAVFVKYQQHTKRDPCLTADALEKAYIAQEFPELPKTLTFSSMPVSMEELNHENDSIVFKYGNQTQLTEGLFVSGGTSINYVSNPFIANASRQFTGQNLINVMDVPSGGRGKWSGFADKGDSGAFAFIIKNDSMRVFGIVAGKMSDGSHMVIPIEPVLQVMNIQLE